MLKNTKLLYTAFAIAFIVMIASAYWLIRGVVDESGKVETFTRDTVIGVSAQTSQELYSMLDTLYRLQNNDESATIDELNKRFDILWSRIETNSSGQVGDVINRIPSANEGMQKFKAVLTRTENTVVNLNPSDREAIDQLLAEYRGLLPVLNIMRQTMIYESSRASVSFFNRVQQIGIWAKILLPSMLLSGFIVAIIFYRDRKSLNDLTNSLELRVEERTGELKQSNEALLDEIRERKSIEEKLVQAQKMEVVGQLTGGIAHDFNNLLAIIQGNAELLEAKLPEDSQKFLKPVLRAADRGSELTQRLLAFSRQQPLTPASIDLLALSNDMTILLQRALGAETEISIVVEDGLWLAHADPGQVENALLNLAINADHAMPRGGRLKIELRNTQLTPKDVEDNPEASPGDYVQLSIQDTGVGMDEDTLRHVFEPFFTTKEVGKGSGLGLSMVYGFVRQSGGHIDIESTVGVGTNVKIFLPRATGARQPNDRAKLNLEVLRGDQELVLLIEDDMDLLTFATDALLSLNYRVQQAKTHDEARKFLSDADRVDVILSDVIMTDGMIGPEFFAEFPDITGQAAIIYMSGLSIGSSKRTRHLANHPFILNKPFKRREMALMLHRALDQKSLSAEINP